MDAKRDAGLDSSSCLLVAVHMVRRTGRLAGERAATRAPEVAIARKCRARIILRLGDAAWTCGSLAEPEMILFPFGIGIPKFK